MSIITLLLKYKNKNMKDEIKIYNGDLNIQKDNEKLF